MENREMNFFIRLKKDLKLQIKTCVVLCLLVIGFFCNRFNNVSIKVDYTHTIVNDLSIINQVERVSIEGNRFNISGYAFFSDIDSDNTKISVLLRSTKDGTEIWSNVIQKTRNDVNNYFINDSNYDNSGFIAIINKKKLNNDECYEILVKLDNNNISKTILSNRYLANEEIYSYNPYDVIQPISIESKLLNEVFSNGDLYYYQKESELYIYRYNEKLYWVANENHYFDPDGLTYFPCYMYSLQRDRLSESTKMRGFENSGFFFEENEYIDESAFPYRIAIREIPDTYPITYISTGVVGPNKDEWLWGAIINFNPIFE